LTDFDCAGIHIAEKVISYVIGEERIEFEEDTLLLDTISIFLKKSGDICHQPP
jgi:hypothetical protein